MGFVAWFNNAPCFYWDQDTSELTLVSKCKVRGIFNFSNPPKVTLGRPSNAEGMKDVTYSSATSRATRREFSNDFDYSGGGEFNFSVGKDTATVVIDIVNRGSSFHWMAVPWSTKESLVISAVIWNGQNLKGKEGQPSWLVKLLSSKNAKQPADQTNQTNTSTNTSTKEPSMRKANIGEIDKSSPNNTGSKQHIVETRRNTNTSSDTPLPTVALTSTRARKVTLKTVKIIYPDSGGTKKIVPGTELKVIASVGSVMTVELNGQTFNVSKSEIVEHP
jgi:hypothetical protein